MMTNDDEKFRQMLRGLGKEFYHQTVTTGQVEDYISLHTGLELKAFFNQYLRTTNIPHLEYEIKNNRFYYRFTNIVNGFSMPVKIFLGGKWYIYSPTAEWQSDTWPGGDVLVSQDYLLERA
jgi:aminopeptidase N